jgi:hypothetical protein
MRATILIVGIAAAIGAGLGAAAIDDAVEHIERVAAARDAAEAVKAGKRQQWRDGTLLANTTVVRKSRAMARLRQSTR